MTERTRHRLIGILAIGFTSAGIIWAAVHAFTALRGWAV